MLYNIHYDISALIIYLFTIYCVFYKKGLRKLQNKFFLALIFNGLIASIFDIIGAVANSYAHQFTWWEKDIFNYVFLVVHNCMPFSFLLYIIALSGGFRNKTKKRFWIITLPVVFNLFVFIMNPKYRWVFFYDKNEAYQHGPMMNWLYVSAFIYIFLCVYYLIKRRRTIPKNKMAALMLFFINSVIAILIQFCYPSILLELFTQALTFLGILFTIENEDEIYSNITGVYNRSAFLFENELAIKGNTKYYVITIKLMNLKYYTTTLGVSAMNHVMRQVAIYLDHLDRRNEVYDCENGIFSMVIYDYDDTKVRELAELIKKCFQKEWTYHEMNIAFVTRICVMHIPEDADTLEKMLIMIDADYERTNSSVTLVYANQLNFLQREIEVENALRRALDQKKLRVYFQPIWDRKHNKIRSAEALIRLFDDKLGYISPEEFIPISERNGTVVEIGELVFEEVCKLFSKRKIRDYGIEFIELNLSTVQCMHRSLADTFRIIMANYNVMPSCFNLEITESAAVNSPEMFIQTMQQLKNLGFKFSMDDYGTGYSNFSYMFDLDFDIIKLDKSILWNAEKNKSINIILKNTIKMIKEMGLSVVMEGVETEAQMKYVSELGCDYCQGFYFSKAIDADSFIKYCQEFNLKGKK